jgi:uncharacterized protein (DUF1015 family)
MALLKPFRGVRPAKSLALTVAAPPYDVVNSAEARALARGNENSFFRVSRPEVDLPETVDEHDDAVYARGKLNLQDFLSRGVLAPDAAPAFYAYRQTMGAHRQLGLVAVASVAAYEAGRIKKHELTRADKEDDRTRHVDALGGNDEPVFLAYRARPALDALMREAASGAPEVDFVSSDGIGHTLWVVGPALGSKLERELDGLDALYIADGHHRSAAAARVAKLRAGKPGNHDWFLAVSFPHDQLQILDYNRLVKDLGGLTSPQFLARLEAQFEVGEAASPRPPAPHTFGLYLDGRWRLLRAKAGSFPHTPVGALDVSILQKNVLEPILKIGDPRKDPRIDFVGGIRGHGELEARVNSGAAKLAFSMFPTSLPELMAIADAGEIMPPKSTWFEPKLRSGLFLHLFEL